MSTNYDRYSSFRHDGIVELVPFIKIPTAETDIPIVFDKKSMRLDLLSYKYYGDANYGWLILQANPHVGGYEFLIPSGTEMIIPYPFTSAINRYRQGVKDFIKETM